MYTFTIFKNAFDNKTHRLISFETWDEFEKMLFNLAKKEGQKGGNNSSPLISPAVYIEGSTRSNRNVDRWGSWCCLDVDDITFDGDLKENIDKTCGKYEYICYSTASSKKDNPKFRLVFPLTREIKTEEISHFWFAINKQTGDIGDKQTKDFSRMYYVPAVYPNADGFIFKNSGKVMDPEDLMQRWQFREPSKNNSFLERLPKELREQVILYRKSQMENKEITWTSYKDCPFFPKKLAQEYMVLTNGWYHKMYQIMVAIAGNAIKSEYPITSYEISKLCKELDIDTGNWYNNRPMELEANSAIEFVYKQ